MSSSTLHDEAMTSYARRYIDAWHRHDPEAIVPMHTLDTVFTSSSTDVTVRGHDDLREALSDLFVSWPDLRFAPQRMYGDGDVLFVESIMSMTQARPMWFAGIEIEPTGRRVQATVVDLIHLRGGLIANKHSYVDELGYLRAMGCTITT